MHVCTYIYAAYIIHVCIDCIIGFRYEIRWLRIYTTCWKTDRSRVVQ